MKLLSAIKSRTNSLLSKRHLRRNRELSKHKLGIELLECRSMFATDTITIFAAGDTGQENMELQIDGVVVSSWNNVGVLSGSGAFSTFTYNASSTGITPERIRIAFTNHNYVAGTPDRNLRVDKIVVNSTTYQTEASTVYSTGTWLPADGIVPGFRQSEYLHAEGYFQYAVANTGSVVQIFAAGEVGPEAMTLQIDGNDVANWSSVGTGAVSGTFREFNYRAAGTVQPNQIRILFTNDTYNPPVDYNLRVDRIVIDGVTFQTESPTVYSTGTYISAQGAIVPGYWETEWLHSNGYFQFGARVLNPGFLGLESSVYSVGEAGGFATIAVVRTVGSEGPVSIDYKTVSGTALSPADFTSATGTLTFANGETRKTISVPILDDTTKEPPESFNFVIENPKGGATLLAPRTATVTIQDNDLVLPNFATFPAATGLKLNGNASIASNTLQLTPAVANNRGSAFYATPIPLNDTTSFQTQFRLKTTGTTSGGDGFTFIVQNSAGGASSLGAVGSGLGYSGILKSFAIEFDTVANTGEVNNNHISIWRDGNMVNSLSTKTSTIDFNGGADVYVWVDYYGDLDQLSLFISSTTTKPTSPVTTIPLDMFAIVGTQAYFGFGAATSTLVNAQRVVSWSMNLTRPTTPPIVPAANLLNETVVSGLNQPIAMRFSNDGRNMYIAQKGGQVVVVRDGVKLATPFIDISQKVNSAGDRGLLDVALHPDFANNPYVYLLFTYDPPEVNLNVNQGYAGPDEGGNRAGRLVRVTADPATNYTTAIAGSEVILLGKNSTWNNFNAFVDGTVNIAAPQGGINPDGSYVQDFINSDSNSHTVGSMTFGVDGSLFVSIGDGASYNTMDPRGLRVQDVDSFSGKILRIDPITGKGYANNPFQNGNLDSNRSKVYQLGLRNPFRIITHPTAGKLYVGDVGWTQWEEINSSGPGANFGWPYYEGGNGTNLKTPMYQDLQKAKDFYASGQVGTPSIYGLNHAADGINAIVLGDVYTGTTFPAKYQNNLFFNDLGQGVVRNISFGTSGAIEAVETFATGAIYVVQILQGRDGNLYYVDLDDGKVGRWKFVTPPAAATAPASRSTTASAPVVPQLASVNSPSTSLVQQAVVTTGIFSNAVNPFDVDDDGFVSPIDTLLIINHLNGASASREASAGESQAATYYLDVNGDGIVSPLDVLTMVNRLNQGDAQSEISTKETTGIDEELLTALALDTIYQRRKKR